MAKYLTEKEYALTDIPWRLRWAEQQFNGPRDAYARAEYAKLSERKVTLEKALRYERVTGKWAVRQTDRLASKPVQKQSMPSPMTDLGIDEVIEGGCIVDLGGD